MKPKIAKKSTFIDMTPMVDLAFLLITFFMLTVKFTKQETEKIVIPGSTAQKTIPARNLLIIYGNKEGKVRVGITEQAQRDKWLLRMGELYKIQFTPKELEAFRLLNEVPVDIRKMKQYLALPTEKREQFYKQYGGVPLDTTDNQLDKWIFEARMVNKTETNEDYRIAIKADKEMPYPVFKDITATLKKQRANKFSLITNKEGS
jgi:biopolymer transport protein ExbD